MLALINNINTAFENKEHSITLFTDQSKAFDCVNQEKLSNKLKVYAIRGIGNKLLQSYLHTLQQCVYN